MAGSGNQQDFDPLGLAVDSSGNLFIADEISLQVWKIAPGGSMSVFAGYGISGPAVNQISLFAGIAVDTNGNVYIADPLEKRVFKADSQGKISVFAGTGKNGPDPETGALASLNMYSPRGLATDKAGNVYIADTGGWAIRVGTPDGQYYTIAEHLVGFSSTGPAIHSRLTFPFGVFVDPSGNVYVADTQAHTVDILTPQGGPPVLTISSSHTGNFPLGATAQYTLTATNIPLAGPTHGSVTVTDWLPEGLTIASMSGDGWTCPDSTCTRTDTLSPGASYPPIHVTVNVSTSAPSQITNQVTVSGGGAATTGAQDFTLTFAGVTIQTTPPGLQFSVDGLAPLTAPQTLPLAAGTHTISVEPTQNGDAGTRYVFENWSDSGAASHSISADTVPAVWTANFKTQYQLTTMAIPAVGGTVSPDTGSFFNAGSTFSVSAAPIAPYLLDSWSGDASGDSSSISILMDAPKTLVANFSVPGFTCAVAGGNTAGVADVQLSVSEALGMAQTLHDLTHDNRVDVTDTQKVINAASGQGCVY